MGRRKGAALAPALNTHRRRRQHLPRSIRAVASRRKERTVDHFIARQLTDAAFTDIVIAGAGDKAISAPCAGSLDVPRRERHLA